MFFGRGGHLRDDFPRQLRAAQAAAPSAVFEITEAAGESDGVLEALAEFALRAPTVSDSR
jgi:sirohydrochlorin cobaltochelatase